MTRIFVSEILCGGGWVEPGRFGDWAPALLGEAWAMLAAVSADFAAIAGVQVATLLDERLDERRLDPRVEVIFVTPDREAGAFEQQAARADFALVIAPEIGGVLERRCAVALDAGARLLGPTPAAIALASDKLALARLWESAGVPTPATRATAAAPPPFPPPWIVKPRFGAGSTGVMRISDWTDNLTDDCLVQPLIPGRAASVALLIGPKQTVALAPCWQRLDGEFHYLGGSTPMPPALAARAIALARHAIDAVPGLHGYVGVDLVLGDRDVAIEINPRLTTSYVGLRHLIEGNLTEALLRVVRGETVELSWKNVVIEFDASGAVTRLSAEA